jgi:photosystem II stability/assembly factor-like uncharacterized protein
MASTAFLRLAGGALVCAVVMLAVCGPAGSAETAAPPTGYRWKPVAVGAGGFITGFSADRSGTTRVVRADVYGAYLWLPKEERWAQLVTSSTLPADMQLQNAANDGVYEIIVAPSNPDRLYMAFKGSVFRSDNRGASFRRTASVGEGPLDFDANSEYRNYGPFMAASPDDPDLLFLGTPSRGLWRSRDGGASWQRVASVPESKVPGQPPGGADAGALIWFEPRRSAGGRKVWVMSPGHGVYVSADDGTRFTPLPNASSVAPKMLKQGDFAPDGAFFGVDPASRSAWRYQAGAWTDLTATTDLPQRRFAAVAVDPKTSRIYAFDEGGKPFVSVNGGGSWWRLLHRSQVGAGDPPWLHVSDQSYFALGRVQFDPLVPGRLWAGTGTGVYYADLPTLPSMVTWTSKTRGIEELVANDVVKPPGQSAVFAAWDFGIHVKKDLDSFSTTYGPKERVLIAAQQVAWSPSNPAFLATNASDTRMNCCSEDGDAVLAGYSLDNGHSWRKFESLPQPPGTRGDDPWRMSFGTLAVSAGDIDNIVWEPTFNRAPYYTKDRGATWARVVLAGEQLPFTGSHAALHYHRKTLAADRVQAGVFYLVHSGDGANAPLAGLWVTRDGGARWTRVFRGEIAGHSQNSAKLRAVPGHAGHLFFTAGVYGPFDTTLRRSVDGGESWTEVEGVDQVDDIAFGKSANGASYPAIYLSGRVNGSYGIWRSDDEAKGWRRIGRFAVGSLDQVTVMEGDPDVFGRVYLGYKGSGWAYGEPAACAPAAYRFPAKEECAAIQ